MTTKTMNKIWTVNNDQPHSDYGTWENFLKDHELRDVYRGIKYYGSTNHNYIIFPVGLLVRNYGYHGRALMNRLRREGIKKVRKEVVKDLTDFRDMMARIRKENRK